MLSARAFLVRGLLCGLLAGLATFVTAFYVGEPHVQAAIDVEEAHAASEPPAAEESDGHAHEEDGTVVSRHDQRTWGLLTGSLGIGTALGGLTALVAAGAVGRIGRLRPAQSTALVALLGWVSISLVPFLKYPATPPAVGDEDTIGARTAEYFVLVLVSVVAAALCVILARRLLSTSGTYIAVVAGAAAYLLAMVVVGQVLPTVDEIGDFPGDTLWYFRRASVITTATLWAVLGVLLTGTIGRLHHQDTSRTARRALAASL